MKELRRVVDKALAEINGRQHLSLEEIDRDLRESLSQLGVEIVEVPLNVVMEAANTAPLQQIVATAADLAGTRDKAQKEWSKRFIEQDLPKIFSEFREKIQEAPFASEYKIYYILDHISSNEIDLECLNNILAHHEVVMRAGCRMQLELGSQNTVFEKSKQCGLWIHLQF